MVLLSVFKAVKLVGIPLCTIEVLTSLFFKQMLLSSLLLIPLLGILAILINKDNEMSLSNIK